MEIKRDLLFQITFRLPFFPNPNGDQMRFVVSNLSGYGFVAVFHHLRL